MLWVRRTTGTRLAEATMCTHVPLCPDATARDRDAARLVASHPEQGWSLLCNGVVVFEDRGELLPDRTAVEPRRPVAERVLSFAA